MFTLLAQSLMGALPVLSSRTARDPCHPNVAMVGKHASNFVTFASDGRISSTDAISSAIAVGYKLMAEIEVEADAVAMAEELVDALESVPAKTENVRSTGKLVLAEEKAEGRVSTRDSHVPDSGILYIRRTLKLHSVVVMLYLGNMGGVLFWIAFWLTFMCIEAVNM